MSIALSARSRARKERGSSLGFVLDEKWWLDLGLGHQQRSHAELRPQQGLEKREGNAFPSATTPCALALAWADNGSGCGSRNLPLQGRTRPQGRLSPSMWVDVNNSTCPYAIYSMQ